MKVALIAAIVVHLAIIAALTGTGIGSIWHPGPDTIEGTDQPTGFSGMPVKSRLHSHTILVVDDSGKSIDSAVVLELLGDRVRRTRASGAVNTTVRSGAMLVVRVTRSGLIRRRDATAAESEMSQHPARHRAAAPAQSARNALRLLPRGGRPVVPSAPPPTAVPQSSPAPAHDKSAPLPSDNPPASPKKYSARKSADYDRKAGTRTTAPAP